MSLFEYDLSNPLYFIIMIVFMFIAISIRYVVIAGLFYIIFYSQKTTRWNHKKINPKAYPPNQFATEIKWSFITALLFAIVGAFTVLAWQKGYTSFYTEVEKYGWLYLPFSLITIMLIHETYYYWIHRLMHHPRLYVHIHKVHHDSKIPSPFTAFSFHPTEGLAQAIILPLLLLIIPVHYYVLFIYLFIMTFSSVINHLDIEIYPKGTEKHWLGKWFIGASHHSLHHSYYRHNFGLYFTFWDKLLKTENPRFKEVFNSKSS